jgi:aconitase B
MTQWQTEEINHEQQRQVSNKALSITIYVYNNMTIYPQKPEEGSKIITKIIASYQNNLSKDPKIL